MPGLVVVGLGAYTESPVAKTSKIKKADGRSRKDLELFVLALVIRGVATPYDLKVSAGISPGASIPVLSRLKASGWIRTGDPGSRNRQEYLITAKGTAILGGWREAFQSPRTDDLESILRKACLALLMGEPSKSVAGFLKRAAAQRKAPRTSDNSAPRDEAGPGAIFLWMRQLASADRIRSEATLLLKLATSIRRLK
jgi:DNA-binding PadR family transcriptional regulator